MKIYISCSIEDEHLLNSLSEILLRAGNEIMNDNFSYEGNNGYIDAKGVLHKGIRRFFLKNHNEIDIFIIILTENTFKSKTANREMSEILLSPGNSKVLVVASGDITIPSYLSEHLILRISDDLPSEISKIATDILRVSGLNNNETEDDKSLELIKTVNKSETEIETIAKLRGALNSGSLTLMCGAGVSMAAGIPVWNKLLENLFYEMLDIIKNNGEVSYNLNVIEQSGVVGRIPPLILGKYIKNNLEDEFLPSLRKALYKSQPKSCETIKSIVELCRPQRDRESIDSIITFNFDGLIEEELSRERVIHKAIYSELVKCSSSELAIYHVHGYLPREGEIKDSSTFVFSEDGYHSQFIEPFSWSNIIQIQKLTQNTCLMVGISLTDPNMRRLLDVAWRKSPDEALPHFIIKKKPNLSDKKAQEFVIFLEEQDANRLGINVIWIEDYDEIPNFLMRLIS